MLDKEAILQLSKAEAITAAAEVISPVVNDLVALPNDFSTHDLERYLPLRRRARGTMQTSSLPAFAEYVAAHAEEGASVFIDGDAMAAVGVLNLGTPSEPGHADNRARLGPKKTAAMLALQTIANGQAKKQSEIAEFLEDWGDFIECAHGGVPIALPKAIAAVRAITIESMRKLGSEEGQLSATRSAFESVNATSPEQIPTLITFKAVPYADLSLRSFALRLAIITGGEKPQITLRVINVEKHAEEMAAELVLLVQGALRAAMLPVLIGSYAAAA